MTDTGASADGPGGFRYLPLALLIVALGTPVRGTAQVRVEVGPLVGYYRPLGSFDPPSVTAATLPGAPEDLKGSAWGGLSRVWFGSRFGVELRGSVARSTHPSVNTPGGPSGTTRTHVATATLEGLFTLLGTPARQQLWISAGVGAVRHGGDTYEPYDTPTDIGPVVGGGARIVLTRHLHATAGVSTLFYNFDIPMPPELSGNPGSLQRGRQVDLLVHLGLTWMPGGR